MIQISTGRGLRTTDARRIDVGTAEQLCQVLARHTGKEAWWSPNTWKGDTRGADDEWEASGCIAVDLDWYDDKAEHAAPPEAIARRIDAMVQGLNCTLAHRTPRGHRVVFMFDADVGSKKLLENARKAAEHSISMAIGAAGLGGLEIDQEVLFDDKRLLWTPNCDLTKLGEGTPRAASIQVIGGDFSVVTLAALAPKPNPKTRMVPPPLDASGSRWVKRGLELEAQRLASQGQGERNRTLNKVAFRFHRYALAGAVLAGDVDLVLTDAANAAGLTASEIRQTLASARKSAPKAGALSPPMPRNATATQQSQDLTPQKEPTAEGVVAAPKFRFFYTATELADECSKEVPTRAIYLVDGAITEMVGMMKQSGKSTFALHMMRAITRGDPFLGESTVKSECIYLSEMSPSVLTEAIQAVAQDGFPGLHTMPFHLTLGPSWEEKIAACLEKAKETGAKVLVIDTFSQWVGLEGDDENSSGKMLAALKPVQQAAGQGLAVMLLRHPSKSGQDKGIGMSARGSTAISGAVDLCLEMTAKTEGGNQRNIRCLGRYTCFPSDATVELTPTGYRMLGDVEELARRHLEANVRDYLDGKPPMKLMDILEMLKKDGRGVNKQRLLNGLNWMVEQSKTLCRIGSGGKGDAFHWVLATRFSTTPPPERTPERKQTQRPLNTQLFAVPRAPELNGTPENRNADAVPSGSVGFCTPENRIINNNNTYIDTLSYSVPVPPRARGGHPPPSSITGERCLVCAVHLSGPWIPTGFCSQHHPGKEHHNGE